MRITDSTLAFATSHAYTASMEAHRTVTAWEGDRRLESAEDVKVTLSQREASAALAQVGDGAYGAFPGRGTGLASGLAGGLTGGIGMGHGRGRDLAALQASLAQASLAQARPSPLQAGGVASMSDGQTAAEPSLADSAWLLLIKLAGDEEGASRLAARLAAFAQRMHAGSDVADTLAAVARAHPVAARAAAASGQAPTQAAPTQAAAVSGQAPPPPPPAEGWGYREDVTVRVAEHEEVAFAAAATVRTADGREISIDAAFAMARDQVVTASTSVRKGDAARDPLVLALGGGAPALGSGTSAVDVNNDGVAEQVASLAAGTAYLVRDLNGNGTIDSGAEMFGPATDNGFAELAALDSDGNGWIDEGDAVFAGLAVWDGTAGGALRSIADAGVGAIATGNAATQYSYGGNTGTLAAASIFLYEDGGAGFSGELKLYA
jgi:hypothetical protein